MDLFNWLKLPKNVAWPIVLVSGLLLWGPENFNKGLDLDLFVNEYRIWVGVAFLFFLATGLMQVVPWVFSFVKKRYKKLADHKLLAQRMKELTPKEKDILRRYIESDTKAQDLDIQDGVVGRLLKIGFLERGSNVSYGGHRGSHTFPVNIQDRLWNEFKKHPEYLQ